jgi:hypothetical protein
MCCIYGFRAFSGFSQNAGRPANRPLQQNHKTWRLFEIPYLQHIRFEGFSFGSVRIDGVTYENDIVTDRGQVRKRKKKPSKKFRDEFGHTPLSIEEHRYADLAVVANVLVANEAEEQIYLQEYFGAPPASYQAARFYLMKQLAHMFYAMAFLSLGSAGKPIDWSEPVPAYSDFQRRFWAHEVDLADGHSKTVYGRVHWEQFRHNLRQPRFDEALRIVANRHAAS